MIPSVVVGLSAALLPAPAGNPVTRLQASLRAGTAKLAFADEHGYLKSVLAALDVPESSQVLVFSKTSLQRSRIGPKTPRAIYFNDDVFVGYCLRGDMLEVSTADSDAGTAFYTLDQDADARPRFVRQTDNCLTCHGSTPTRGVPGHLVRSVAPDPTGNPIPAAGSYRTDPSSPFEQRWGGWYVTGTHGDQRHLGNAVHQDPDRTVAPEPAGQNVTDLRGYFTAGLYPTPHSDLVALLVLEHQADAHNKLAWAGLETRAALKYQADLNRALGEPAGKPWESVERRIKAAGDGVLKALLFAGEAALAGPVAGTSGFAREFAARGPFDRRGRSLREFDLSDRVFRYPCSYLIYSAAFDRLPAEVRDHVLRRLYAVLTGADGDPAFTHLSATDLADILAILRDTKPGLPAYWR